MNETPVIYDKSKRFFPCHCICGSGLGLQEQLSWVVLAQGLMKWRSRHSTVAWTCDWLCGYLFPDGASQGCWEEAWFFPAIDGRQRLDASPSCKGHPSCLRYPMADTIPFRSTQQAGIPGGVSAETRESLGPLLRGGYHNQYRCLEFFKNSH